MHSDPGWGANKLRRHGLHVIHHALPQVLAISDELLVNGVA